MKFETYTQAVSWLFDQFPSYQNNGASAYKPGLKQTTDLLQFLGVYPENMSVIHVAGTNGKGSTCSYMSSILTENNEKVGLFTSPHIFDFRERIRINGVQIDEASVVNFCQRVIDLHLGFEPSFFEVTFAMAIDHFQRNNCSYAVIETGMGGRLDSTNVLQSKIAVITNIGLDHTQFLGETLPEIAMEKAGIIKSSQPVVIGQTQKEIEALFIEKANSFSAPISFADKENWNIIESLELPEHQKTNLKTALCALQKLNVPFSEETIQKALQNLHLNTGLFGRLTKVSENPLIYLDVSHNQDGIQATLMDLRTIQFDQLHIIYGASQDKNASSILSLFPDEALIHLCEFRNNRSLKEIELLTLKNSDPRISSVSNNVNATVKKLMLEVPKQDLILVTGSFFLLADVDLAAFK
jgi:dihydrofolate synthase / folylpolyglutamate synthase